MQALLKTAEKFVGPKKYQYQAMFENMVGLRKDVQFTVNTPKAANNASKPAELNGPK